MKIEGIEKKVKSLADMVDLFLLSPEDAENQLVALGMTGHEARDSMEKEYSRPCRSAKYNEW